MDSQIWESSVDGQVTEAIAEIMDWNVCTPKVAKFTYLSPNSPNHHMSEYDPF